MKHIYLIGAGGVGMVWIADYALGVGWKVSGSDSSDSAMLQRLVKAGANLHVGCDVSLIPPDVTEVVITAAITPGSPSYPEYEELVKRGVPIKKRAQWTGSLSKQKRTIAVCGSHGKTTTTAMIGWILDQAGYDPTVFVGSNMPVWDDATKIGNGDFLVLEADEFDRSFHNFYPEIAVVLNIDLDHTDYYKGGMPEIEQSYKRFLRNLPVKKGMVVGYGRDSRIRKITRGFKYHFRWYDESRLWPGLRIPQPGKQYLLNATAAARVAHEIGIPQATILKALKTFPGVGRRFEYLGKWQQAEVYDDYGHHPAEVAVTLEGFREKFPEERITLVYQAHQKARTQALLKEFGSAFLPGKLSELIIAPIYYVAGREEDIPVSNESIATEVRTHDYGGMTLVVPKDDTELKESFFKALAIPGVVVIMGAGDIRAKIESWQ